MKRQCSKEELQMAKKLSKIMNNVCLHEPSENASQNNPEMSSTVCLSDTKNAVSDAGRLWIQGGALSVWAEQECSSPASMGICMEFIKGLGARDWRGRRAQGEEHLALPEAPHSVPAPHRAHNHL